jgi:aconitate hydratase
VVAYALKGTVTEDFTTTPIGQDQDGADVYLKDIWPTNDEVHDLMTANISRDMFLSRYANVYQGDEHWQAIQVEGSETYQWRAGSTYVANPPYFEGMSMTPAPVSDIIEAKPLAILGDSITTDHISPAGSIKADSPAGKWLMEHQVSKADFNSYGARRGHHEVMMRGTLANIRIKNEMVPGIEGGMSRYGDGPAEPIYDVAMKHKADGTAMIIVAGKEYGTGSSRDWAAKGHQPAWREGGDRRKLRAHPPFEPCRHGRVAAAVQGRRKPPEPWPRWRLQLHHHRRCQSETAPDRDGEGHPQGRLAPSPSTRCAASIPPMKSNIS